MLREAYVVAPCSCTVLAHLCLSRQASWLGFHVCLNVVVLNSSLSHVFEADAVVKPLCPLANRFCGCFVWAPAPFFVCVWFVVVCFAVSSGETQVWLGDLRVVVVGVLLVFLFGGYFDLPAQYGPRMSLYKRL